MKIQRVTEVQDAVGGVTKSWATLAERWASIDPIAGSERLQALRVKAESTHMVTMRHYEGLTTKDRILHGTREFEIGAILNMAERNAENRIECKEKV